ALQVDHGDLVAEAARELRAVVTLYRQIDQRKHGEDEEEERPSANDDPEPRRCTRTIFFNHRASKSNAISRQMFSQRPCRFPPRPPPRSPRRRPSAGIFPRPAQDKSRPRAS